MSLPDREYFEMKFDALHGRITESDKEHSRCVAELREEFVAHKSLPCQDVRLHVEDCHKDSMLKNVTIIGTIIATLASFWAVLVSVFHAGGGSK